MYKQTIQRKSVKFCLYISNDFQYSDAPTNTVLSYAAPKPVIEFPQNVVRILDTSRTLSACSGVLVNFSFSIGSNLEDLGSKTFSYFSKLFYVDLRNCKRLKNISTSCFLSSSLTYISLPEEGELTELHPGSFARTKLIELTIPKTVQKIHGFRTQYGGGPFTVCISLLRINIPKDSQLLYIGYAIAQASSISEFFIPENVEISTGALNGISKLSSYKLHENNMRYKLYKGILYSSDFSRLIMCPCNYTEKIEIHEKCSSIDNEAFRTVINNKELIIPKNVKELGGQPFFECVFDKIIFEAEFEIIDSYYCFLLCQAQIILPKSLRRIGNSAFTKYRGKTIEFYSNIEVIAANTFTECPNLGYIKFNEFNSSCVIKTNAVKSCPQLKYIMLPLSTASMMEIEPNSFVDCPKLKFIKFTYDIRPMKNLFTNPQFMNKTQISFISPHNKSCSDVHLSFPEGGICKIEHFCTSSFNMFSISHQIFNICPFISM